MPLSWNEIKSRAITFSREWQNDPLTIPPALLKVHQALDKTVDAAYGKTVFRSEVERMVFLFDRYQKLTSLFIAALSGKTRKTRQQRENR